MSSSAAPAAEPCWAPRPRPVCAIIDIDPNFTPPSVSQLSWAGNASAITSITLAFTAPLDPRLLSIPAISAWWTSVITTHQSRPETASYNASTNSVTLVPSSPLPDGHYYQIEAIGQGPNAIRDIAGNLLAGARTGVAGTNYISSSPGNKLQYVDNAGKQVTLKLNGPGFLEQIRDSTGEEKA